MTATCNSTFSSSAAMSPPLPPNVFTPVVRTSLEAQWQVVHVMAVFQAISCAVDSSTFLCNLTVDGIVEVAHVPVCAGGEDTSLFDPALPITLGMVRDDQGNMVSGASHIWKWITSCGSWYRWRDLKAVLLTWHSMEMDRDFSMCHKPPNAHITHSPSQCTHHTLTLTIHTSHTHPHNSHITRSPHPHPPQGCGDRCPML